MSAVERTRAFFASAYANECFFWLVTAWTIWGIGYVCAKVISWWWEGRAQPMLCDGCYCVVMEDPVVEVIDQDEVVLFCSEYCRDETMERIDREADIA